MPMPRDTHHRRNRGPSAAARSSLPADALAYALYQAAKLVARVRAGHTLSSGLEKLWHREPAISAGQRGAIQDLAYGTLRDFAYGDALLAPLLRGETPDPIHSLLLVAIHRLEARPDSAHTIVDQCVEAASMEFDGKLRGLVNGVLRSYLRRAKELRQLAETDANATLRHPQWWIERLRAAYPENFGAILAAGNDHPPMALRVNQRRASVPRMLELLRDADISAHADPQLDCALLLEKPLPVSQIPGFDEGLCSVQDPAAQRAAHLLDLQPGQQVLDACAAPGGKSAHILELCDVGLTAIELSAERMRRVDSNLRRLGLSATLTVADCQDLEQWWTGQPFDRILADVPCSASGVVRRNPDIKWLRRDEDIAAFCSQQQKILERLWHTLAAGGKMLYATCSVFPDENSAQVGRFCAKHADARPLPLARQPQPQLLPCTQHDGFFYALLEKIH